MNHEDFYRELTARNAGLIEPETQERLRNTRFVIAGCGSTGGACVMPLARTGAERFALLDPGRYELNNLNRQDASLTDVGTNKAVATGARIKAVNPHAELDIHPEGVVAGSIGELVRAGDVVIDAVDVTEESGLEAKWALHVACQHARVRAITAYDIASTQFIEVYDYARVRLPLRGRVRMPLDPETFLRALIPPLALPREIFPELLRRRQDPSRGFPQLAMTSTLLGALSVAIVLRLLSGHPVRNRVRVDLFDLVRPPGRRGAERARRDLALVDMLWRMR